MEEQQAIAHLRRGDIGGLETLVRVYQVRAIRAAYLVVRDRALAEDIVQSAFVRVYDRIAQFDHNRPFEPWFLKSVINDSLKAITRQESHESLEQDIECEEMAWANRLIDSTPGLLEMVESTEIQRSIWEALDKLSPDQRAVVVLRYYLDFSEAEMTEKLKRPPGTIKWLLHAARERLRDLLSSLGPDIHSERPHKNKD
ncbi:MAG: sigma-70 family RNA polymerase sigma factor [Chloroflexi bacterium]|nr:sigma-70 family RNA polymerase sigma factor [Chloroflexota bacterium]